MALAEFWENVRVRNPLFHEGVSPPDVPRTVAEELDAELGKRQEWKTLGALKGYDEKDFDFFPVEDRARLTGLVTDFNAIAPELRQAWHLTPPNEAKLRELTDSARPLLRDIILPLEQDRYRDPDALRFGKLVERELDGKLPEGVVDLRFMVGETWSGSHAIWVWAILSDETTATDERLVQTGRRVRAVVLQAVSVAAPDLQLILSFRSVAERIEEEAPT